MRYPIVFAWVLLVAVGVAAAAGHPQLIVGDDAVDLDNRLIRFSLTTAASSARIQVFSAEGKLLHDKTEEYSGVAARTPLSVGWPDLGKGGENFRIELRVTDTEGNWFTYQVIRFYLEVPHREIVFGSGKWNIDKQEEEKLVEPLKLLKEAVAKYGKHMGVRLYVGGYTDTVGKHDKNQLLSERRAQSIADYFIRHGLTGIPILVRGFGEGAPAVKTGDNVPEKRNRRARYIISTFAPEVAGPGTWKQVQ